jgi:TRAP-type C4-dicarboxylate transport system substrate-binding protein
MSTYFIPNVLQRTKGQVDIRVVSYPELGISGADNVRLVEDGTLSIAEVVPPLVGGNMPAMELFTMWGLYPDHETEFRAQREIVPDVDRWLNEETKGGKVIVHNWYSGNDIYILSKKPLRNAQDFKGRKIRSFGTTLSDMAIGLGIEPIFMTPADVYTALERGIVEGAMAGATFALNQKWHEVTDYIVGPWGSFPATFISVNKSTWADFPEDIRQILLEEGAKNELEALRIAPVHIELGLPRIVAAGMEHIPFSPELKQTAFEVSVLKRMIPGWVKRVGGVDSPAAKLFNEKVAPIAGVKINPDGSVTKVPVTKVR